MSLNPETRRILISVIEVFEPVTSQEKHVIRKIKRLLNQ